MDSTDKSSSTTTQPEGPIAAAGDATEPSIAALEPRVRAVLAELQSLASTALDAPNGLAWAEHLTRAQAEVERLLAGPTACKAEQHAAFDSLEAEAPETFAALAALAIRLHEHGGDLLFQLAPGHFLPDVNGGAS